MSSIVFWVPWGGCGLSSAVSSPCLKQDGQDEQDLQDGGRLGRLPKGLEDLNVYRDSRKQDDKVR